MADKKIKQSPAQKRIEKITHKDGGIGKELNFICGEAYKLLRTNVTYSLASVGGKCKVIGVSSAVPNEGKSYTSINLAYTYALEGKKTLLINGDMRNPSYSRFFNQSEEPGLSNLFIQSSNVIRKNLLTENLDVIFAGPIPPNPAELLGSSEMGNLLEEFKKKYDYIVLDLPPINLVSDALNASRYTDGILVVVRHKFSHKKDLFNAMSQLKFVKANILGFVYNDFSYKRTSYYSKNRYYKKSLYGYGYGTKNDSKEAK